MKSPAIFFDAITVAPKADFAFDVWYANHYLPGLSARREFVSVQRYGSPRRATYLAVFEMDAAGATIRSLALPEPAHESIVAVERYCAERLGERKAPTVGDEILDADILYPVFFQVPADREPDFNAWYDEEHLAILQRCQYWPMCRRFRITNPGPASWTHLALHYLTDLRALESAERTEARSTPWRARLAQESWFRGDYRVYYRYGPRRSLRNTAAQERPTQGSRKI